MKIITIIGARPQIIKASALSRAIRDHFSKEIEEIIVHTGQHYDQNMSEVFFTQLQIPKEKYNLGVGSSSHGVQTAKMIVGIEEIIQKEQPDAMVVYGDTNSTLAGAIAASKIYCPIVHVEAGLRSFDKHMPEEVNRILCDNVSTLLFSPTKAGYDNLVHEGFSTDLTAKPDFNHPNIYHCGDIMYDNTLHFSKEAFANSEYAKQFGEDFILCTIHRNANTDDKDRLTSIFQALLEVSKDNRIILPLHPRTRKMMPVMLDANLYDMVEHSKNIEILEPVSFLEMTYLEAKSKLIITDSGGVQKEAYYCGKPAIILRPQTEWTEIVATGNAMLADADGEKIVSAAKTYLNKTPTEFPSIFGDGKAAEFMCMTMLECL